MSRKLISLTLDNSRPTYNLRRPREVKREFEARETTDGKIEYLENVTEVVLAGKDDGTYLLEMPLPVCRISSD